MPESALPETLFVRLYLDRHIKKQLAVDLRERGFEVLTTEKASRSIEFIARPRRYGGNGR
jgi:hypothetical protein